jgi:hypothetical protein
MHSLRPVYKVAMANLSPCRVTVDSKRLKTCHFSTATVNGRISFMSQYTAHEYLSKNKMITIIAKTKQLHVSVDFIRPSNVLSIEIYLL